MSFCPSVCSSVCLSPKKTKHGLTMVSIDEEAIYSSPEFSKELVVGSYRPGDFERQQTSTRTPLMTAGAYRVDPSVRYVLCKCSNYWNWMFVCCAYNNLFQFVLSTWPCIGLSIHNSTQAEIPRDAFCSSVVSFSSAILVPRTQSFIIVTLASDWYIQLYSLFNWTTATQKEKKNKI